MSPQSSKIRGGETSFCCWIAGQEARAKGMLFFTNTGIMSYFAWGVALHMGTVQGHWIRDYPGGPPSLRSS